jgi:hypothetical protein
MENIVPHVTNRSWTEADIARLKEFSEQGASVNRAAAALGRKTDAIKRQCRVQGFNLVGTRQAKAAMRSLREQEEKIL